MRDRHPEAVIEGMLQLQALPGERQPIGRLSPAEQEARKRVADLGESELEVAFLVDLVRPEVEPLGSVEVAVLAPEQAVVMKPLGAGRARDGGLAGHRALGQELVGTFRVAAMQGEQGQEMHGRCGRSHRPALLGQRTGPRKFLLGLGGGVLLTGLDQQPPKPQPGIERRRARVQGDHPAEPVAGLRGSSRPLRLEGEVEQVGYRGSGHVFLTRPGHPRSGSHHSSPRRCVGRRG